MFSGCLRLIVLWLLAWNVHVSANSTQQAIVIGAGSVAAPLYQSAIFSYSFVNPNAQVYFFDTMGGDQAICRMTNYTPTCAAGEDGAQPMHMDWGSVVNPPAPQVYQRFPDIQLYPTCANPIIPVYNLNGVTNLVLTMEILAKIYSRRITTWDHPDIQATNQNTFQSWNIPVNQSINIVLRQDAAGTTTQFKLALAGVDPQFMALAPNWSVPFPGAPTFSSPLGLLGYVYRHPYSLGYAAVGDALQANVQWAKLNRSGTIVGVSTTSVQYAILEKGLSFGNNNDAPAHLTANLINALNPLAWPIVSYLYVAVRKSTLRPGATCDTVSAMMDFWVWFWNSDEVMTLADELGFVVLPEVVRNFVVARFQADMMCNGSRVWQQAVTPTVAGYGTGSALFIFDQFQQAYALVNSSVVLNYTTLASDQVDVSPLLQGGGFLVSTTPPSIPGVYSLVLGSEAVLGFSMAPMTLDVVTLAKILNGDITTWLDPAIRALNPGGLIFKPATTPLNNTAQRIVLLQGPTASSEALTALLQASYPAYNGSAVLAAETFSTDTYMWTALVGTPYSFSVAALAGGLPTDLTPTVIMSGGVAVVPSLANATACTTTYNPVSQQITTTTASSGAGSCYPLLLTLYVSFKRQCPMTPATSRTVTFLQWMFAQDTLVAAMGALNIVALSGTNSAIQAANDQALFQLSCQQLPVVTNLVPLLLAVIIPIAVVLLIVGSACGWWLWRITEANRLMRKKFSNDNVAESCAEAIACFDLDAVEWLKEVKEPNKIQLSFLAIINLLTEVKPYIPDQLLSQLTAAKADECHLEDMDRDVDEQSQSSSPNCGHPLSIPAETPLQVQGKQTSFMTDHSGGGAIPSPAQSMACTPRNRLARHFTIASTEGARQMIALRDWRHKRCTYMSIRFGCTHCQADRRLLAMSHIVGNIVDVAKANGATIDAVGADAVNVHWGVTTGSGAFAIRAVQAGLEILKMRDNMPDDQRATLWLQMGIGKGPCDCGSVSSASGHRFFVVWGPEASLAIEIAACNLPRRVVASLLITPAVYQEVQFTVQCMPRLWHGDALLWEPLNVLKKKEDDEWMYELQKMDAGSSLSNKTMLELFLMAKCKTATPQELLAQTAELRSQHSSRMSASDAASLDMLLVTAGVLPTRDVLMTVVDAAP